MDAERAGRTTGRLTGGIAATLILASSLTVAAAPAFANRFRPCGRTDGTHAAVERGAAPAAGLAPATPATLGSWPRFHYDGASSGLNPNETQIDYLNVPKLVRRWHVATGGHVESSPIVSGGIVYVGSDDQSVYAFDELTGRQIWSYRTAGMVQSSPAVSGGVLFVGSEDGTVYALNAITGKVIWKRATGAGVRASPNVANGIVYVGSRDGTVYALHASDGTAAWTYRTGGPITSSAAVFRERSGTLAVYVGSGDTDLYALDAAKGTKLWSFKTGGAVESSPAVGNWTGGGMDIVVFGSDDLSFYGLNADTGQRKWVCATNGIAISSPSLNLALGRAYWGTNGWDVQGHNLTDGLTQWSYTCGAAVRTSPAVANGLVYGTCGKDQHIYALREELKNRAGPHGADPSNPRNRVYRMVWNYDTGAPIESSPAVVDGMVFTGSDAGLFAFALP